MLIFCGFPNFEIFDRNADIKYIISIGKQFSCLYEKQMNINLSDNEYINTIKEIQNILESVELKQGECCLSNFIQLIIWFDKITNHIYFSNKDIIGFINKYLANSDVNDFVRFINIDYGNVLSYGYSNLIDKYWDIDFRKSNDITIILSVKAICQKYGFNYKEKLMYILNKYYNDETINFLLKNFNQITNDDLVLLSRGLLNKDIIIQRYKHNLFLKELINIVEK